MRLQVVVVKKTIIFGDNVSKSNLSWYNISWDQGNVRLSLRTFELKVLNYCGVMLRLKLLTDPTCIIVTNIFGKYFQYSEFFLYYQMQTIFEARAFRKMFHILIDI